MRILRRFPYTISLVLALALVTIIGVKIKLAEMEHEGTI